MQFPTIFFPPIFKLFFTIINNYSHNYYHLSYVYYFPLRPSIFDVYHSPVYRLLFYKSPISILLPIFSLLFMLLTCPRCSSRHILYSPIPSMDYIFHFKYPLITYTTTHRLLIHTFHVIYNFLFTRFNVCCLMFTPNRFLYFTYFLFSIFIKNFVLAAAPDMPHSYNCHVFSIITLTYYFQLILHQF